jgi:tryptophanyl-tRNA synthetase
MAFDESSSDKYAHVKSQFDLGGVTDELKEAFPDFRFFERNLVMGQRDLEIIAARVKAKKDFVLVSGFAPSGELHFGHKSIIDTYSYFRKFTKRGYFIISDIDSYISRADEKVPTMKATIPSVINNIANALAMGVSKEDIVIQSKQSSEYFTLSHMISKKLTFNTMKATLGHDNMGKFNQCYLQIADILYPQIKDGEAPTLIPAGIDQEPIIRLARDVSKRLADQFDLFNPMSSIYLKHVPSMLNMNEKMSKSIKGSGMSLIESKEVINSTINRAITGGRDTAEEQRKLGADINKCTVCRLLQFTYQDTNALDEILRKEASGETLCGQTKEILKNYVLDIVEKHKKAYEKYLPIATKMAEG